MSSTSSHVNWIYPGPLNSGLTFNYIDTVYFTWESSIADPWMNLWCSPGGNSPQSPLQGKVKPSPPLHTLSRTQEAESTTLERGARVAEISIGIKTAYHAQMTTNGTSQQQFPYSEYEKAGICHMQLENFAGDDFANTPRFGITSNDAVQAQTWGLKELASLGGGSSATASFDARGLLHRTGNTGTHGIVSTFIINVQNLITTYPIVHAPLAT